MDINSDQKIQTEGPPSYFQATQYVATMPSDNLQTTITTTPVSYPGGYPATAPPPGFISQQVYPAPQHHPYPPPNNHQPYPSQQNMGGGYPQTQYTPQYPPPQTQQPLYGSIQTSTTIIPPTEIVVVGGCPVCRIGMLENDFTCCGICCAIVCFPIGIICCLAMREKRCTNCGTRI